MIGRRIPVGDLNTDTGLAERITGADYARQKIRQRLLFIMGEWFLDTRKGMPWFEEILIKNPDLSLVQARVRDCILGVPGMTRVDAVEVRWDRAERNLALAYHATYETGEPVTDIVASPVSA
jgi:hypothetical protein